MHFFQVHSFLAAIFAALSDLLPWHDDISVLSFTASSLTGCTAPCKHPQLRARLLPLVERETEAGEEPSHSHGYSGKVGDLRSLALGSVF